MMLEETTKPYLGFLFQGGYYRYARLPMGVSNGVYYFQLFVRALFKTLPIWLQQNVRVYVDDFVVATENYERCRATVDALLDGLSRRGISINTEKPLLTPTRTMMVLGFQVENGAITLTIQRREELINAVKEALPLCRNDIDKESLMRYEQFLR